jgi:hypothetical protein
MNSGRAEVRAAHGELVEPLERLERLELSEAVERLELFLTYFCLKPRAYLIESRRCRGQTRSYRAVSSL